MAKTVRRNEQVASSESDNSICKISSHMSPNEEITSEKDSKEKARPLDGADSFTGWRFWEKRRYVVASMAFLGFFNVYALRVNLSIAIVAMTENKTEILDNGTMVYSKEFDWDSKTQGYVLSSFFYGYITTQILGGYMASHYGGKKLFGWGIGATALMTIFTPLAAYMNVYVLIFLRIMEGVFEGVTYPCIHAVWAQWAPPLERSRLATIAFTGSYVGTVVSMPVCAFLATILGWPSIFYIFGMVGLFWWAMWEVLISESPTTDPLISEVELKYITNSLGNRSNQIVKHPWRSILTSTVVWAIVVAHFSENWGFYTLLTQLPKFMKDILNFELGRTGLVSALPYLAMSITIFFAGQLADWLQIKQILTTTQVRKVFNCGAFISQGVFMLAAAYLMSPVPTLICLTLAVGLGAFAWAGFSVNHLDVAPQHASVLMGIGNTVATLPGIVSPILSGYIVTTPTAGEWQIIFIIAACIYLFGCVFYAVFASGELQPWAEETTTLNKNTQSNSKRNLNGIDNKSYQTDVSQV